MKISDRIDKLEKALVAHLIESGAIRSDLKWLKNALLGLYGTLGLAVLSAIAEAIFHK